MKYQIRHRLTNEVIYTADINTHEKNPESLKLGIAVMAAIKDNVSLRHADLRKANLTCANLRFVDLHGADLSYANLSGADLYLAYMKEVNLDHTDLNYVTGNNKWVRTLFTGTYSVTYTATMMCIGCESHLIDDWWGFDDIAIGAMDGAKALKFWRVWKPILQSIIAAAPACPTGYSETGSSEDVEGWTWE